MSALFLPPTLPPTSTPSPFNSLRCTSRRDSLPLLALQLSAVTIAVSSSPSPVSASHAAEDGDLPYPTCDIKRVRFPCPVGEAERFASTHITYSPSEYDRTPILISEEGRSCVLPERGSKRCYSYTAPEDVPADLASYSAIQEDVSSEDEDRSDGSAESGGSVSVDEEEVMDRRIAMMRSLGLAGGGGGSPVLEGGYWAGEGSEEGEGHVEFSTTTTTEVVEEEEDGEDELMRIRERCRTRFGMWRVETAEFAAEDPNACNSPREPCTPNPSPMSPPSSLERVDSLRGASSVHSLSPPPTQMSYFDTTPSSAPIAIPFQSASGSSSNTAGSFDSPASATPTSSFVTGLAIPRRSTRTKRIDDQGKEDDDEDEDEDDSPASLGSASPATRRMLWCRQMKLRCFGGRSSPDAQTSSAVESDVEEEEECRDEGRGMRRWLSFDDRIVSDSPPPTPAWDEGLPNVRGFPITAPTTVLTSLPNLIEGGFELPSTPLTTTSFGRSSFLGRTSVDTLLSSTSTSTATPVDSTPTSSTSPSSTVQQQPSPPAADVVPPVGGLTVLSSPSSSACSSSDTGSFSTDSDPPSLDSLLDDDRWGVELERSPCFRDGGKLDLMSLCEAGERGGAVLGSGGW